MINKTLMIAFEEHQRYVMPKYGLMVRYPNNKKKVLPKEGGYVPFTGSEGRYWRRRLKDGSIEIVQKKAENKKSFRKED